MGGGGEGGACRNLLVKSIQLSLKLTSSSTFWETLIWNVLNVKPVADLLYPRLVRLLSHLFVSSLKFYVIEILKGDSGLCFKKLVNKNLNLNLSCFNIFY